VFVEDNYFSKLLLYRFTDPSETHAHRFGADVGR
jgi:hypothetical protein